LQRQLAMWEEGITEFYRNQFEHSEKLQKYLEPHIYRRLSRNKDSLEVTQQLLSKLRPRTGSQQFRISFGDNVAFGEVKLENSTLILDIPLIIKNKSVDTKSLSLAFSKFLIGTLNAIFVITVENPQISRVRVIANSTFNESLLSLLKEFGFRLNSDSADGWDTLQLTIDIDQRQLYDPEH